MVKTYYQQSDVATELFIPTKKKNRYNIVDMWFAFSRMNSKQSFHERDYRDIHQKQLAQARQSQLLMHQALIHQRWFVPDYSQSTPYISIPKR